MPRFLAICAVLIFGNISTGNDIPRANIGTGYPATSQTTYTRQVAQTKIAYRQPIGHTHTCTQCGDVWDHSKNPTHNCTRCGSSQTQIDQSRKLVPIYSTEYVPMEVKNIAVTPMSTLPVANVRQVTPTFNPPLQNYTPTYVFPSSVGGCPGGNCSSPSRGGVFRIFR